LVIDPVNETPVLEGQEYPLDPEDFKTDYKWSAGVLAPNGKIFGIPNWRDKVLVVDYDNGVWSTQEYDLPAGLAQPGEGEYICSENTPYRWSGGVLAPNGKVYVIPSCALEILIIDPEDIANMTYIDITSMHTNHYFKYAGGVLAPNGKIYAIPGKTDQVLEIDPTTNTVVEIGDTLPSGDAKWRGGVLAANGKIYGIPYNSPDVLEIDPSGETASASVLTNIALNGTSCGDGNCDLLFEDQSVCSADCGDDLSKRWSQGVLGLNGKIYGIPGDANFVLEFDPQANGTLPSFVPLSGYFNKY
jgi:hypothetical protein